VLEEALPRGALLEPIGELRDHGRLEAIGFACQHEGPVERDQFTIDRAVRGPFAPALILVVNQADGRDLGNPLPAEDPREILKPIRRRGAGAEPLRV
jgi:hypothetical protein